MSAEKLNLAFLTDTMGPYHYARLKAANLLTQCTFVEFSSIDHTNYWETSAEQIKRKVTLFHDKPITEQSKRDVMLRMNEVLTSLNPNVVVISGWDATASLLALQWCVGHKIPAMILSESQFHDFKRNPIKEFIKKQLLTLFQTAFVGGRNQVSYLSRLGFDKRNIYSGCDLVDNQHFYQKSQLSDHSKAEHLSKLALPKKFFLTSCRLVPKKNLKFLLAAFKEFLENDLSWSLVITGDGPLREELQEIALDPSYRGSVYFPGYVEYDQMPIYYALSSCFILPSITEQWGLVVNEALACGKPVLVSQNCGSAPNLVENKNVGYTFDPMNLNDLVNKMQLISQENNLSLFSKNAHAVISELDEHNYALNLANSSKKAIQSLQALNLSGILTLRLLLFLRN